MKIVGRIMLVIAAIMMIPAGVAYIYNEPTGPFTMGALVALLVGAMSIALDKGKVTTLNAYVYVSTIWFLAIVLGAIPFALSGMPVADSIFESASGYSAMGGTCLVEANNITGYFVLNGQPIMGLLFWRALMQLIGGIGIIIMLVALTPKMSSIGRTLLHSEAIGTESARQFFTTKAKGTARILLAVYLGLNVFEIALLKIAGMNWYDAITHAFATVSTGGYSPMANSIMQYNSLPIEIITMVFIVLGGSQLCLMYSSIKEKKNAYFHNEEFKTALILVTVFTAIIVLFGGVSIRAALYSVISFMYTCGFVNTMDYNTWNAVTKLTLISAMIIGGCLGSTAGGIKVGRVLICAKVLSQEISRFAHPHEVTVVKADGHAISSDTVKPIVFYAALYMFVLFFFSIALGCAESSNTALDGVGILAAIASSMAGVGPAFSSIWASYASLTAAGKIVCALAMYVGRLEMIPIFLTIAHLVHKD